MVDIATWDADEDKIPESETMASMRMAVTGLEAILAESEMRIARRRFDQGRPDVWGDRPERSELGTWEDDVPLSAVDALPLGFRLPSRPVPDSEQIRSLSRVLNGIKDVLEETETDLLRRGIMSLAEARTNP